MEAGHQEVDLVVASVASVAYKGKSMGGSPLSNNACGMHSVGLASWCNGRYSERRLVLAVSRGRQKGVQLSLRDLILVLVQKKSQRVVVIPSLACLSPCLNQYHLPTGLMVSVLLRRKGSAETRFHRV